MALSVLFQAAKLAFGTCSGKSTPAGRFCAIKPDSRVLCRQKTAKTHLAGLSKAGVHWYTASATLAHAPKGCLLRKPPDGIDRRPKALANDVSAFGF
jgi:hypothetical protein